MIPTTRPHRFTGRAAPLILGHEWVGNVVAVGEGVDLALGQRVCGDSCLRCGRCFWCLRGEYNICERGASIGLHADGAFAALLRAPAYTMERVPDSVPDRWAAIVEPLAVGLHAVRQGRLTTGETVVVVGYGMIGAAAAAMSLVSGAARVFVVEPSSYRRERALQLGAEAAWDPNAQDVRREVLARTARIGADLVVDCSGHPTSFGQSVDLARRGGRVVVCGVGHAPASVDLNRIVFFEREVTGSLGYRFDHQTVLNFLATRRLDAEAFLGETIPLERIVTDGFDRHVNDPMAPFRIPVVPN
jgi:(R,R)-butanediol dehydrogenase/meso-butanediol dehydrogenase/diacetyl reductase